MSRSTESRANQAFYPQVPKTHTTWIKRSEREANHSFPPSAEIKNAWSYSSAPLYVLMAYGAQASTETTLQLGSPFTPRQLRDFNVMLIAMTGCENTNLPPSDNQLI